MRFHIPFIKKLIAPPQHNRESVHLESRNKERWILTILSLAQFAHVLDFVILMPLGPQVMREFQITPSQFGLLVSVYTLSAFVTGLISAFIVDRYDRKYVLIVVFMGFSTGTLFCALSWNYHILLLARSLAGAFGGIMGAILLAIIGDIFPAERRGRATGIVMSAFSVASVAGVPIGLAIASFSTWHLPFVVIAMICFLFLPIAWIKLPHVKLHLELRDEKKSLPQTKSLKQKIISHPVYTVFTAKSHWWIFFFMFTIMMAGFSVIPFLSPYLVSTVHVPESRLWMVYFTGGMFTLFTSRYAGHAADKFGKAKVFSVIACISIIPILFVTNLHRQPLYIVIPVTTFFMIFVSGRLVPALALVTGSVHPEIRGSFMSINSSIQQLSSGIASLSAGHIVQEGVDGSILNYNYVGFMAVFFILISLVLVHKVKRLSIN